MKSRLLLVVASVLAVAWLDLRTLEADVVAVENRTETQLQFRILRPDGQQRQYQVDPGDVIPVPVNGSVRIVFQAGGVPQHETLEPNSVYCFRRSGNRLALSRLGFPPESGLAPIRPGELPAGPTLVVLHAIVEAAQQNASLDEASRLNGDRLTEHLFRRAAAVAQQLPAEVAAKAYLLALGIGLDDSNLLRLGPIIGRLVRRVESDAERQRRLAVLGSPTMRGRRDLAQHFVVSSALTVVIGPRGAEAAGVLKELSDCRGGLGFSFVDLSADLAGVTFATHLRDSKLSLDRLARSFAVEDFLPPIGQLREGISWRDFQSEYGCQEDDRFLRQQSAIRQQVLALPGYQGQPSR